VYPLLKKLQFHLIGALCIIGVACSSSKELTQNGFTESSVTASEVVNSLPNYNASIKTLKGKGRAIVSEPGNTERVTILFSSHRTKSLVTVRNGIGIEGGQLLTDGDTLLVYNKLDKFARKIAIRDGSLSRINRLASLNILDMINYTVAYGDVKSVWENNNLYRLMLTSGSTIYVDKESNTIRQVVQPDTSDLPYSKITYDGYASIKGFTLPRRISIFGRDGKSKVALQLTALQLNPKLDSLTINLPNDIPIYYE